MFQHVHRNLCVAIRRHSKRVGASSLLVGLLLFSLFTGILSYAETTSSSTQAEFHFTGTESGTTESFTVEEGWEVHWKSEGTIFQLAAFGVIAPLYEGQMTEPEQIARSFEVYQPIILANSSKPSGKAFHRRGGTFYLRVKASGPWSIRITTIKLTKDYLDVPYTGAP